MNQKSILPGNLDLSKAQINRIIGDFGGKRFLRYRIAASLNLKTEAEQVNTQFYSVGPIANNIIAR